MRIRRLVTLVFLGLLASAAQADAPPVGTWVALQVNDCQAVTFEAPSGSPAYVPGERYRTTRVAGQVVDAGLQDYDHSQAWLAQWARDRQASLPSKGSTMTVVLERWDEDFCRTAMGAVRRFDHVYTCDTLPRRGVCLAPHPLVKPTEVK